MPTIEKCSVGTRNIIVKDFADLIFLLLVQKTLRKKIFSLTLPLADHSRSITAKQVQAITLTPTPSVAARSASRPITVTVTSNFSLILTMPQATQAE
jgi:hypothetical protein